MAKLKSGTVLPCADTDSQYNLTGTCDWTDQSPLSITSHLCSLLIQQTFTISCTLLGRLSMQCTGRHTGSLTFCRSKCLLTTSITRVSGGFKGGGRPPTGAREVRVRGINWPPKIWDWGKKNWHLAYVEQAIFNLTPCWKWFPRAWPPPIDLTNFCIIRVILKWTKTNLFQVKIQFLSGEGAQPPPLDRPPPL